MELGAGISNSPLSTRLGLDWAVPPHFAGNGQGGAPQGNEGRLLHRRTLAGFALCLTILRASAENRRRNPPDGAGGHWAVFVSTGTTC